MIRILSAAGALLALGYMALPAQAESTVKCVSRNYQYDECWAGPLKRPQLIHQISSSACILNRSWGYNPQSGYIWVANGCAGVFADVTGYHYGRGGQVDPGARTYDEHGHDVGAAVGAAVIGAIVGGIVAGNHHGHQHTTSNVREDDGYNGCHGIGCMVTPPNDNDTIDTRPQFDKEGNPNFDIHGNYQGCHGVGCFVDDPDSTDDSDQ